MNKACRDIIALNLIPGLGPRKIAAFLERVRETEEIFRMPRFQLDEIIGERFDRAGEISSIRDSREYAGEIAYIEKENIDVLCYKDRVYPGSLRNIYDPPPVLYCKGDLTSDDADAVAIVGARRCSAYGLRMAERLAFDLAERGVTVISGMARGIDSAAHRGALKAGGRTIAVMGSGFRHIYPLGSEKLMRAISKSGAVLTEYPSDIRPFKGNFPRRNRIISGMARGVVVVEAARKSGAMITVDLALQQGREVFAVPGRVDFHTSSGTNLLIQNGAKLVTGADDILEEFNLGSGVQGAGFRDRTQDTGHEPRVTDHGIQAPSHQMLVEEDRRVLRILKTEGVMHIDRISELAGMDIKTLPETLIRLEVKGLVKTLAGRNYVGC